MTLEDLNKHIKATEKTVSELEELLTDTALKVLNLKEYAKEIERQQPQILKLERWKPEIEQTHFYVGSCGNIFSQPYVGSTLEVDRQTYFNCFETYEEAKKEALRTRARRKLEWLARELNGRFEGASLCWSIALNHGQWVVISTEGTWTTLCEVRFIVKQDAEYALSQMKPEELEALR
jgi:hypothetical protein